MTQTRGRIKYFIIFIAFVFMCGVLVNAYLRNIDDDTEYTRRVRHVVVNAYELELKMLELQSAYNNFVLGHPSFSKDKLDLAHGIAISKYDTLLLGDTYKIIHPLKEGEVIGLIQNNFETFQALESDISNAQLNDKNLVRINDTIENKLIPNIQEFVKAIRIGTNWKSVAWETATKESRRIMQFAMIGILVISMALLSLLIFQFRATREALIQAEQAKVAKAKFLTVAGHDLRQPLQASSLLLSTLQAQSQSTENERLFKGIHHSLDSITELLNGMLDISRLDADLLTVNKESIPVTPLVNKMMDRYEEQARKKNLNLSLVNPNDSYISSDELLLERVISNLLSNAIRYTHKGDIRLIVDSSKDKVLISIHDSGSGISEEDQKVIFKEFIQLDNSMNDSQKGLGLGLSIVKRLCKLLDHELALTSKVGRGSQFKISLPKAAPIPLGLPNKTRDQWSLNGVTIIVVEDNEDISISFNLLLTTWGCTVLTASDMEQATTIAIQLKKAHSNDNNDLLIISDYHLHQDYNGCDVIENIQKIMTRKIPAMVITAETDPQRLEEIRLTGNSVFRKPLKPATLRVVIQRLLRQA